MGNPRSKRAVQTLLLETEVAYNNALKEFGFKPMGETPMGGLEYVNDEGVRVVVDKNGWTIESSTGKEHRQDLDFGSGPQDLVPSLTKIFGKPTKNFPANYEPPMSEGDKIQLRGLGVKARLLKKAVGLTNQGQPDAVCPKCQQPIAEGAMVNYPNGKETHVQCPAPTQQGQAAPGQQAPGWQSRLNLPPGYQQKQQPAPAKQPGMISPNVGRPQASLIARINNFDKKALFGETKHHHFSFEVPMKAGGNVAFYLAKAGLDNFEASNYKAEGTTEFSFKTEPEMHIAEEIIRAEFAQQISGAQGAWKTWSENTKDLSLIKSEREVGQHLMSSEKIAGFSQADKERLVNHIHTMLVAGAHKDKRTLAAEILEHVEQASRGEHSFDSGNEQSFYRGKRPQLVKSSYEGALKKALSALNALAKLGPDADIRDLAKMSANDLSQSSQLHTVVARDKK